MMSEEPDGPQEDPAKTETPTTPAEETLTGPEVIRAFVKTLPAGPGVYRMLDHQAEVLYVGKARNLKKRVTSYTKFGGHTNRIARVIANTASMEFVTTGSETEALLLEANLIKRLKPRYNIILRDDKSFPHILVTGDHDFPQILKHRGAQNQEGEYFGPFASALSVNQTLNTLQRAFLLRSCSDSVFENRTRPCLLYQIKRCSAPCVGYIDQGSYKSLVEDARDFLRGKSKRIKDQLTDIMETASKDLDFERAAVYRDRIRALSHVQLHQGINPASLEEADVIAADEQAGQTCVQVFFFRANQNWGNRAYYPRHDRSQEIADVLEAFVAQFYDNKPAPKQILLSHTVPNQTLLEEALSTRAGRRVSVLTPQRGEKKEIVAQAQSNAKNALARRLSENASERQLLEKVAEAFGMSAPPERIEVYDNSHIQGAHPVGGMIVSGIGGFQKNQYRKFNIKDKDIAAGDDYGMLEEVLSRRFSRLIKEEAKRAEREDDADIVDPEPKSLWPDLVLIDGGAGQLSVAQAVFEELGIEDVTLVSIAKGPDRNAGRERFFMPGRPPFSLEFGSPVLYFLQRLRDEAHRFAIGSHRARRQSAIKKSALDSVPGIGAARKRALLNHFGSARAVERAGLADLQDVEGISKSMAQKIYDYFHENQ